MEAGIFSFFAHRKIIKNSVSELKRVGELNGSVSLNSDPTQTATVTVAC